MSFSSEWSKIVAASACINELTRKRSAGDNKVRSTILPDQAIEAAELRYELLVSHMFDRLNRRYGYLKPTVSSRLPRAAGVVVAGARGGSTTTLKLPLSGNVSDVDRLRPRGSTRAQLLARAQRFADGAALVGASSVDSPELRGALNGALTVLPQAGLIATCEVPPLWKHTFVEGEFMRVYRCFFFDEADHIKAAEIIDAEALTDAIDLAQVMLKHRSHHRAVELWDGGRKVYYQAAG